MNATTVAVGGVVIGVREWGGADGRPLVFWPGLNPWGALALVEVGPLLAERGLRVIGIDPPGVAGSASLDAPDDYLPTRLARLVLSVADARGFARFAYLGWSWGASIGVHLAAAQPQRIEALALLDAGHTDVDLGGTLAELEQQFEAEQVQFSFESWDAFFDSLQGRVPAWRPALEPRFRAGMTERDGRIVANSSARAAAWALHGVVAEPPSSTHRRLGELGLPVLLVLASESDTSEAAARFAVAVPQADVQTLDAGH